MTGDYNADGLVTSLDYDVWRATFGTQLFPGTAADGNGGGTVDASDYVLWRRAASSAVGTVVAREISATPITEVNLGDAEASTKPTSERSLKETIAGLIGDVGRNSRTLINQDLSLHDYVASELTSTEVAFTYWPSVQVSDLSPTKRNNLSERSHANSPPADHFSNQLGTLLIDWKSLAVRSVMEHEPGMAYR